MTRGTFLKTLLGITLLPSLAVKAATTAKQTFLLHFKARTYLGSGFIYAPYIPICSPMHFDNVPECHFGPLTPRDMWQDSNKERKAYYNNHRVCPHCGGEKNTQTLMAFIWDCDQKNHPHEDRNKVYCQCGWKGIVHDLKPRI